MDFYFIMFIAFQLLVFLFSIIIHEVCHGAMAYKLGDSTAKDMGRLTFNPLKHLDLYGSVLLPLMIFTLSGGRFIFGSAKPVPYNPNNLRDKKFGNLKVAIAGPGANFLIALILGLGIRFFGGLILALSFGKIFISLIAFVVFVNIILFLFNLLPFPPFDGSKIVYDLFPKQWGYVMQMGIFGLFIGIIIAYFFLGSLTNFLFGLIVGRSYF